MGRVSANLQQSKREARGEGTCVCMCVFVCMCVYGATGIAGLPYTHDLILSFHRAFGRF